ncbi:hypothetical protein ES695_19245 [Candidatus Atribacteria bacterium 1244-E10-H5-B2]|nr:MAG: hypothetical protein ES695_19245 [Candidatus Atribacteria bacterium 1244-E10-H5-B2]
MTTKTKKKSKVNITSPQKTDKKELNKLELEAFDRWRKRKEKRVGPLKFEKGKRENEIVLKKEIAFKIAPQMMETIGSSDTDFFSTMLYQATGTLFIGENEKKANFVAAFMHGLNPGDEMEGVLVTQMVGAHNLIMEYMKRAMLPEQTTEAINDNTNRAYKLMNIFLKQIEALSKYRGKTVEQKVTVEHVHVYGGGKAIVGHVEGRQTGGGDKDRR